MIKKLFLFFILLNVITSEIFTDTHKEQLELKRLYNQSNQLKIRMLKEIEKKSTKKTIKKKAKKNLKKKTKKKTKKHKAKKRDLKNQEVFYLKKLVEALSNKKNKKPKKKIKRKLKISKNTVEAKNKYLNDIIVKSKTLMKEDRKLFAEATVSFGLEGIGNVFNVLKENVLALVGHSDLLQPMAFIYLIIGIYKYYQNFNIQHKKLLFLTAELKRNDSLSKLLKDGDDDVQEALYGIAKMNKKIKLIISDTVYRFNKKIDMFTEI